MTLVSDGGTDCLVHLLLQTQYCLSDHFLVSCAHWISSSLSERDLDNELCMRNWNQVERGEWGSCGSGQDVKND